MGKIINPHKTNQGGKVKVVPTATVEIQNFEHPIFCFRYLHKDFCLEQCGDIDKKSLMERLVLLSGKTWQELSQAHRYGLGWEKISIKSIKAKCPSFITDDVNYLLAFRYSGKKPFLGHRNRFVFHVIFIDRNFTLYDHS